MDAVVSWLFKLKVPPQPSPLSSSTSPGLTKGWVVCGEAHVHWHSTSATTPRKAYGMVEEGCRNRVFLTLEIQRMKPKAVINASRFITDIVAVLGVAGGGEGMARLRFLPYSYVQSSHVSFIPKQLFPLQWDPRRIY